MDAMIVLEPRPSSAAQARRWVREQLRLLGRDDLVDSAVLATSEIVTNAILHARTPITVRVVGSSTGGRVCISDLSREPLHPLPARDEIWSSGRGLGILSAVTRRWGVDDEPPGKCVWFEPNPEFDESNRRRRPRPLDLSGLLPAPAVEDEHRLRAGIVIVLRGAPLRLLWQTRRRFCDIRREMILLLGGDDAETPGRLVELALRMDPLPAGFIGELDEPADTGDEQIVRVALDPEQVHRLTAAADLFDEVDAYCRAEHLLTLAASPSEAAARRWVLSEIGRQMSGLPPRPWAPSR